MKHKSKIKNWQNKIKKQYKLTRHIESQSNVWMVVFQQKGRVCSENLELGVNSGCPGLF